MVLGCVSRPGFGASLPVAIVCGCLGILAGSAHAQLTVPPIGVPQSTPLGNPFPVAPAAENPPNFQYQTNLEPSFGLVPSPGFQLVPRIGVAEEFNDNVFQTETDRRWDLTTLISPGVAVSNDTPKLQLNLNYNPIFRIYSRNSSLNSVGQQLNGVANAVIVPDEFYVNARAYASELPTNGGFTGLNFGAPSLATPTFGGGSLGLNKNNLSQVVSASVTPYLVHRFGSFGTGKLGVSLSQSYTSRTTGTLISSPNGPAEHGTTGEAIAQFLSGDDWGRFVNVSTLDASKTYGQGALSNSSRAVADSRLGYVVRSWLLVFGEAGYESIQYSHVTPKVSVNDGIWGIGATLLPNQDSRIILEYGHREGSTSFQALARYAVTARTAVSASYTVGITSDLQSIESQLEDVGVSPLGTAINLNTGAPASIVNSLTGINNTVFRAHTLLVTASTLMDRNTLSASLQRQNQEPLASTNNQPLVNNVSTSGTLSWVRDISLRTTLTTSVSYGVRTVTSQNENFFGGSTQLRYIFTDNLSGSAGYSFYDRHSNVPGVSFYENIALVSLTRTF